MINNQDEDLMDYLLKYATDHNIKYKFVHTNPVYRPISFKKHRMIVINLDWKKHNELCFATGHEIAHVIFGNYATQANATFTAKNDEECDADLYSLKLIYNYSCRKGDVFEEPGMFMQAYGIPDTMSEATKDLFSKQSQI